MSNVTTIEPRPQLTAGAKPSAIVPTDMDSCYRLAKAICVAGMAPRGLETPEKAMVAIMHGLEIGLTPMAALQRIAVVNGRPTIWGDGAIGLVRGSGLCEYVKEWIDGEGDSRKAVCEVKRRAEKEPVVKMFSVTDAKRAKLWNKQGPWQDYPERMLAMRARAFALRDTFADVLGGLHIKEETEDYEYNSLLPPVPSQKIEPPVPPTSIEHKPEASEPPVPEIGDNSKRPILLAEKLREAVNAAVSANDASDLEDAWDRIVTPHITSLIKEEYEHLQSIYADGERALEQ